jgi:hypothetical protein
MMGPGGEEVTMVVAKKKTGEGQPICKHCGSDPQGELGMSKVLQVDTGQRITDNTRCYVT